MNCVPIGSDTGGGGEERVRSAMVQGRGKGRGMGAVVGLSPKIG